jgi:hypothetical protein
MINVGIIGGGIYGRGINPNINVSPNAKLDFVYSTTNAGKLQWRIMI